MEFFEMFVEIIKINLSIRSRTCSQTLQVSFILFKPYFEVFEFPFLVIRGRFLPILILRECEERDTLCAFPDSHDRRDEFNQKSGNGEKTRVKGFKVIDNETLDVTSVVILIRHDHEMTITKRLGILIFFTMLKTHNLSNRINFSILHDQVMRRVSHIEQFTTKRENYCQLRPQRLRASKQITADNGKTGCRQGLC